MADPKLYTLAEAKSAGLLYDPFNKNGYIQNNQYVAPPKDPQDEAFWIRATMQTTQFYADAAKDRELAKQYGPIAAKGQSIIDSYNQRVQQQIAEAQKAREEAAVKIAEETKKVEAIKQEVTTRTREGAERSSSRMRARRAGGGLLAAASSPDLSAPATGPILGSGAPSLGGSMASFGSSSVLGTRVKI